MLVYIAAKAAESGFEKVASWLNLLGGVLFTVEALIDTAWTAWSGFAEKPALSFTRRRSQSLRMGQLSSNTCWDTVNWELWSSVFFLIPSLLYLVEALADPNIKGIPMYQKLVLQGFDMGVFAKWLDWGAVIIFIVDGLLRLICRWRIRVNTAPSERLVLLHVCAADDFLHIDWITWGDVLFLAGSLLGLFDELYKSALLSWTSLGLWTMDAILYLIGCIPLLQDGSGSTRIKTALDG